MMFSAPPATNCMFSVFEVSWASQRKESCFCGFGRVAKTKETRFMFSVFEISCLQLTHKSTNKGAAAAQSKEQRMLRNSKMGKMERKPSKAKSKNK